MNDLKLVRNGKKIQQPDDVPVTDLEFTAKDQIILLTHEPHTTT